MKNKISLVEKIGYGSGDLAANLLFHTWNLLLLKFYTDVFGISASAAGAMLFFTRFIDIVTDPVVGILSDRTHTRWGRYRPWILYGSIPLGVSGYIMFIVPDADVNTKLIFAWATYSVAMLLYTMVQIPYSALMGVMTNNSQERTDLSTFRFFSAFSGQLILSVFAIQLVQGIGEEQNLGSITRDDGTIQVTQQIDGIEKPLYFFSGDDEAGDTLGHEIDKWSIASYSGDIVPFVPATSKRSESALEAGEEKTQEPIGKIRSCKRLAQEPKAPTVNVVDRGEHGRVLVAGNDTGRAGITLYTFADDVNGQSLCVSESCTNNWQPFTIKKLEHLHQPINEARGFQVTMALFMVMATFIYVFCFYTTRERINIEPEANKNTDIKGDLRVLVTNAGWLILFLSAFFNLVHVAVRNGSLFYYFDYYVCDVSKTSLFFLLGGIAFLVGIVASNFIARYFGKRAILIVSTCSTALCLSVFYFIPAENYTAIIVMHCLASLCSGPIPVLIYVLYTEVADYVEWKHNRKVMALVFSTMLVGVKAGLVIGISSTGFLLDFFGYVPNQDQTEHAVTAIVMLVSIIPGIFAMLSGLTLVFYPYDEKLMKTIEKDLEARRAKEGNSDQSAEESTS